MAVAVVTGAAIRVGRAISLALARAQYDVIIHACHSEKDLAETQRAIESMGQNSWPVVADLSIEAGQESFCEEILRIHSHVDLIVHNAAVFEEVPFSEIDRATYRKMMSLNLEAPYFITQRLLPALTKSKDPHIIHIVDSMVERPYSRHSHYVLSKAALTTLTRSLAIELGPTVRVNGVAPGAVAFPDDYSPQKRERIVRRIPMKRAGTVDDVANAVVYLAKHSGFVTGHILNVDGGRCVMP